MRIMHRRGLTSQRSSDQSTDSTEEENVTEHHYQLLFPELLRRSHCYEDVHAPVETAEEGSEREQCRRGVDKQVPNHDQRAQ